jgi:branched-chain amino acid transport system substrate-binding protein
VNSTKRIAAAKRKTLIPFALIMVPIFAMGASLQTANRIGGGGDTSTAGVIQDRILVGVSMPLTGTNSEKSLGAKVGSDLYIKKINEEGGVNGRKIELVYLDDAYDPKKTVSNIDDLLNKNKVFCLFSLYATASVRAVMPTITKNHIPLIAPIASDQFLRVPLNPLVFPVGAGSKVEVEHLIKYAVKKLKFNKIAQVYQADGVGLSTRTTVNYTMQDQNLKLVGEAGISRDGSDVDAAVDAIAKSGAQAVIAPASFKVLYLFIRKAAEKGYRPTYFMMTSSLTTDFVKFLSTMKIDGYFTSKYPLISNKTSELVKSYLRTAKTNGVKPNQIHIDGYVNAIVLAEGLKRAGKNPTRDSLMSGLESMNGWSAIDFPVHYSPTTHDGSSQVVMTKSVNGELIQVDDD